MRHSDPEPVPLPNEEPLDPLAELEALRAALTDALHHAGRLVRCVRVGKREYEALGQVWSGFKSLKLGRGER